MDGFRRVVVVELQQPFAGPVDRFLIDRDAGTVEPEGIREAAAQVLRKVGHQIEIAHALCVDPTVDLVGAVGCDIELGECRGDFRARVADQIHAGIRTRHRCGRIDSDHGGISHRVGYTAE